LDNERLTIIRGINGGKVRTIGLDAPEDPRAMLDEYGDYYKTEADIEDFSDDESEDEGSESRDGSVIMGGLAETDWTHESSAVDWMPAYPSYYQDDWEDTRSEYEEDVVYRDLEDSDSESMEE
jgi:hypothetical protein